MVDHQTLKVRYKLYNFNWILYMKTSFNYKNKKLACKINSAQNRRRPAGSFDGPEGLLTTIYRLILIFGQSSFSFILSESWEIRLKIKMSLNCTAMCVIVPWGINCMC